MTRITIIAFGTRGDAQPAIALGKGLQAAEGRVRVLASANFQEWIAAHGLEPAVASVDIQAMMESEGGQEWVEHGHNPLAQTRIMKRLFDESGWTMMLDAWRASQDADLLLSSFTSDAFAVSIAEKLGIRHASMVGQPTLVATRNGRSLPNAPLSNRTSIINYIFGKLLIEPYPWQMLGEMSNRFRREVLDLPPQRRAQAPAHAHGLQFPRRAPLRRPAVLGSAHARPRRWSGSRPAPQIDRCQAGGCNQNGRCFPHHAAARPRPGRQDRAGGWS